MSIAMFCVFFGNGNIRWRAFEFLSFVYFTGNAIYRKAPGNVKGTLNNHETIRYFFGLNRNIKSFREIFVQKLCLFLFLISAKNSKLNKFYWELGKIFWRMAYFGRIRIFAAQIFEIIKIYKYQKTQDIGKVLIILV